MATNFRVCIWCGALVAERERRARPQALALSDVTREGFSSPSLRSHVVAVRTRPPASGWAERSSERPSEGERLGERPPFPSRRRRALSSHRSLPPVPVCVLLACLSVCLSVCLSACPPIRLSALPSLAPGSPAQLQRHRQPVLHTTTLPRLRRGKGGLPARPRPPVATRRSQASSRLNFGMSTHGSISPCAFHTCMLRAAASQGR